MTEQGMTEQDMTEQAIGPIDYLALELPARRMKGEGLAAMVDLVDRGIIRVLDLRAVRREADGTFTISRDYRPRPRWDPRPCHFRRRRIRAVG